MKTTNFPKDYQQVMPYMAVKDAAGLMQFMMNTFDAREKMRFMADEHKIAHAEVTIGDSVIMIADAAGELPANSTGCFVFVPDADAVYSKAIVAGCTPVLPMRDNPYGRSGGFKDPYGNTWWVKTHDPDMMP